MFQRANHNAPILFCHYGDSKYLKYVLACAQHHNPDKQVVLLGDESNRETARRSGVDHVSFAGLEYGEDYETFEGVYQEIMGSQSTAGSFWLRFVFRRWFLIRNFLEREGIRKFWHFDSDNMLLEPLANHETYFEDLDCTEQCGGSCLNGFVANANIVLRFVQKINELFQRPDYLAEQARMIERDSPRMHFNEMVAYRTFKSEESFRSERLFTIRDGAIFDDAVCRCEDFEAENLRTGEQVKRLLISDDGRFFVNRRKRPEMEPVRLVSLNLSWVPLYVYRNVYRHSLLNDYSRLSSSPDPGELSSFRDLPIPIYEYWKYKLRLATRGIRNPAKKLWRQMTG